jgi:hypothetical protein
VRSLGEEDRGMARCNELCTKEALGYCALCNVLAERDRFERFWFRGGVFIDGVRALKRRMVQLWDRSKAPQCGYPVPQAEVRHKDMVREAHKQYSETLNKTMLALLGVALFCLLTTIGSPDKLLLAPDSTIKVPFADTPISFLGFIVVAPFLLIVLTIYLHVFYGYWLDCERERQYINKRLIPPIESIPTLFSFPDAVPLMLTGFIFYWLVPLVLGAITWKAWAFPGMGRPLTYVAGVVTAILVFLQIRRRANNQHTWWIFLSHTNGGVTILIIIVGLTVRVAFNPQLFQRPLALFRAELPKAWLAGINMRRADFGLANLQGANFLGADLQGANLQGANLQGADFQRANLQRANLRANLGDINIDRITLLTNFEGANFQRANLQGADLQDANFEGANFLGANLQGANFQKANLAGAENLTQDQLNTACVDENTKLPAELTRPSPCPPDS